MTYYMMYEINERQVVGIP